MQNFLPVVYSESLKRTSSVKISNGRIHIALSRYLNQAEREKTVEKFLTWAQKKLLKAQSDGGVHLISPTYQNESSVVTHNKVYRVVHFEGKRNFVKLKEDYILEVSLLADKVGNLKFVRELCEKAIIKDQTPYLREVVSELNDLHFSERVGVTRFKRVTSRFGSCSSGRNINIALRLLFAPREVFRYVCVHELAHLKEMNHSKKFWAHVEGAMPSYKESEKWLKVNGFLLG